MFSWSATWLWRPITDKKNMLIVSTKPMDGRMDTHVILAGAIQNNHNINGNVTITCKIVHPRTLTHVVYAVYLLP